MNVLNEESLSFLRKVTSLPEDVADQDIIVEALLFDRHECPEPEVIPKVIYPGSNLKMDGQPYADLLGEADKRAASNLRLEPIRYLLVKYQMINASEDAKRLGVKFNKTLAQKAVNIDGNKASKLHDFFVKLKWINVLGNNQ
jgi:hypothetical protein